MAFKDLSLNKQLSICDQQLNYWRQMKKKLLSIQRAHTEGEKLAIKQRTDLALEKIPKAEKAKEIGEKDVS